MGIPLEIRRVKRPVNTVITTNGTNSAKRYAVRERIGVKYIPGGNPQPIYGKIIGHIIDFKFVPKVSGGSEIQQDNEVYLFLGLYRMTLSQICLRSMIR